jgi:hypothetical protein
LSYLHNITKKVKQRSMRRMGERGKERRGRQGIARILKGRCRNIRTIVVNYPQQEKN